MIAKMKIKIKIKTSKDQGKNNKNVNHKKNQIGNKYHVQKKNI